MLTFLFLSYVPKKKCRFVSVPLFIYRLLHPSTFKDLPDMPENDYIMLSYRTSPISGFVHICLRFWWGLKYFTIFTVRKRSLGQGNIFSSVCQQFCSQGGLPQGLGIPRSRKPPSPGPGIPPADPHPLRSTCWEIRSTSGRYASY